VEERIFRPENSIGRLLNKRWFFRQEAYLRLAEGTVENGTAGEKIMCEAGSFLIVFAAFTADSSSTRVVMFDLTARNDDQPDGRCRMGEREAVRTPFDEHHGKKCHGQ
jgi:hypothetical protein